MFSPSASLIFYLACSPLCSPEGPAPQPHQPRLPPLIVLLPEYSNLILILSRLAIVQIQPFISKNIFQLSFFTCTTLHLVGSTQPINLTPKVLTHPGKHCEESILRFFRDFSRFLEIAQAYLTAQCLARQPAKRPCTGFVPSHTFVKSKLLHLDILYLEVVILIGGGDNDGRGNIPASRQPLCSTLISGNRTKYNERRRSSVGKNHFLIPFLPRCLPLVPPKSFHQSRLDPDPTDIS